MKMICNRIHVLSRWSAVVAATFLSAASLCAQPFGQWDFNNSNLVATVGTDLDYRDGGGGATATGTSFGTTASLGLPSINGTNAIVMRFPGATNGMGFNIPTPPPNGGGSFVDNYTLIMDVLYPAASDKKPRPLLETDDNFINTQLGTDLAIGANNGLGLVGGTFDGTIASNTWYRIGLVVETNKLRTYINGTLVGNQTAQSGRLQLSPSATALLLAESKTNTASPGYVNSIQLRDVALSSDQMTAIGGPSADGIPLTIPVIPSYVQSWKPPGAASSTVTDIGAVINPGETGVDTSSIVLKLNGAIQTGVNITSNGVITVLKSAVGPLTAGTTYTLALSYTDNQQGAKTFTKLFKAALLFEDFEGLTLGTNFDEALVTEIPASGPTNYAHVWTKAPPAGWLVDDSWMPNYRLGYTNYADTNTVTGAIYNDGVGEWNGWSFADKSIFWGVETDNQDRQLFTYGQGTVAVADPDEWDDAAHPKFDGVGGTNGNALYFISYLSTRPVDIRGYAPNSIYMNFDSSWRPEGADDWGGTNNQTAVITVSYNGGAPIEVLRWESIAGPNFHGDAVNEKVSLLLKNPSGATNLVVKFGLINAANDWWWAFDNLEISVGDIPSSILTYVPVTNATGVGPQPALGATIAPGTTTISPSSFQLYLDGTSISLTVTTNTQGQLVVSGKAPSVLPNLSSHTNVLIYTDSLDGVRSNAWSFTTSYDQITLGTPVWFENFDGVEEGALPTGWTVSNATTVVNATYDLNDPKSAAYENFVVVSSNRLRNVFNARRFNVRGATLNGQPVEALIHGNIAYGESDNRGGSQVQVLHSPTINLTGITGVQLAFNSIYEQNQDSLGAVEYSINGGTTWLPALYMLKNQTNDDLVYSGGILDPVATFGTSRSDQAWATNYGYFIGAVVDSTFGQYISGRVDDDATESKRIEKLLLPMADNQSNVRLRFTHTGTGSWYFGIDDLGFYGTGASLVGPSIVHDPRSRTNYVSQTSDLTVEVNPYSTGPLSFHWMKNGTNISGANSQILTLANVQFADAGNYSVIVSNASGSVTSMVATLAVENPFPAINKQPQSQYVSSGSPVSLSVIASIPVGTLTYQWYKDNGLLAGKTNATLSIASASAADEGSYYVRITGVGGVTNSAAATLTVFSGSLGDGLVAYLPFDGNYQDYSGRHNNGSPVGSPYFEAGRVGQALHFSTTSNSPTFNFNYVTLGTPADLQFGTGSFSVGFWINVASTNHGDDPTFIANKDWNSSGNTGWGLFSQGGGNFRVNITGTAGTKTDMRPSNNIQDGNWHFVLCSVWRGNYTAVYVDGVLAGTTNELFTGTVDTGLPVNIGQDGTGQYTDGNDSSLKLDGLIDEVMFWSRVVTPQEVTRFYTTGINGLSPLLMVGSVSRTGNSVSLNWSGGVPPFEVQSKDSLNSTNWSSMGTTTNRSATVSVGTDAGFFRVIGASQ